MSFFDDLDEEVMVNTVTESVDEDLKRSGEGNVGDVCYYDLISNEFGLASSCDSTKTPVEIMDDWKIIQLGIVLNQHEEDQTVDVLMAGFLMAEPLSIPLSYWSKDKQPYIRAYAYDMFKRYVKAFFRQLPGYEQFLKLQIGLPTVADMMKVQQNSPEIFDTLRQLSRDKERFIEYYKRLHNNYIYVRHDNGRIYEMSIGEKADDKPSVIIPHAAVNGDFLCMFRHVDVFNKQKHNPDIKKDEQIFFGND